MKIRAGSLVPLALGGLLVLAFAKAAHAEPG